MVETASVFCVAICSSAVPFSHFFGVLGVLAADPIYDRAAASVFASRFWIASWRAKLLRAHDDRDVDHLAVERERAAAGAAASSFISMIFCA